ncbi:MAG: hypothetical protein HZY77_06520 [Thiobacillus sp.]|nr:MAG: hypothetical protein HZY77_06520 [Thiobacillus sp.]
MLGNFARIASIIQCGYSLPNSLTLHAKPSCDLMCGARPLKRAIQSELENALAKEILAGHFGPKDTIRVDAQGGVFSFEKAAVAQAA